MSTSLRRPDPQEIAKQIFSQLTPQDIRSVVLAMNTMKPDNVKGALNEILRTFINTMDDIIWDISFYEKVKKHVYRMLLDKLAPSNKLTKMP